VVEMAKIYLTRHGQTQNNLENRYTGWQDIPLNPHGFSQAQDSAAQLKDCEIDLIISTPLLRAKQTAEEFSELTGCPIIIEEGLKERSCGLFAGKTKSEVKEKFGISYPEYMKGCVAPEGESIEAVKARVDACMLTLLQNHKDESILIVAHSFVTKIINAYLLKLNNEDMLKFKLKNCEIVSYDSNEIAKPLTTPAVKSATKKVDIAI